MTESAKSERPGPLAPAELEHLLQQLDEHKTAFERLYEGLPASLSSLQEGDLMRARLHRLYSLHAPYIHLGHSCLRWIAGLLNLPILPWGRKQARFNSEVIQTLDELHKRYEEVAKRARALSNLEARITHVETLLRATVPSAAASSQADATEPPAHPSA